MGEIATPGDQQVVAVVIVGSALLDHLHESLGLLLGVHLVGGEVSVILEPRLVLGAVHAFSSAVGKEITLRRGAVVVVHHVNEHVALRALAVASTPDKLQLLVLNAVLLVLVVHTVNTEGIEANISVQSLNLLGVTEGINTPGDGGSHTELVVDKLSAKSHFVNHILVVGSSLISHRPASHVELELAVLNQLMDNSLGGIILLLPPALEETLLDIATTNNHSPTHT